tara:strand:+ start:1223 stop:1870 length:648 start_codon:yes stop_codon:yes gene_type:complete
LFAVSVADPVPPLATGSVPVTPVVIGRPVQLVNTPEAGVPSAGVTRAGEVANTSAPVPVSSVTAARRFAEEGVPRNVATPAPSEVIPVPPFATGSVPVTPVVIGRPVQLVSTPEAGVPSAGVTRAGEVANTSAPLPVSSVTAAARFAEEGVPRNVATPVPRPLTPVPTGSPVQLVSTPEAGVPSAGATKVLFVRVCVPASETGAFTTSMTSVLFV